MSGHLADLSTQNFFRQTKWIYTKHGPIVTVTTMGVDIPCDTSWYEGTSVHGSIFVCACSNETSKAQKCEIQASEVLQGREAFNDSKL